MWLWIGLCVVIAIGSVVLWASYREAKALDIGNELEPEEQAHRLPNPPIEQAPATGATRQAEVEVVPLARVPFSPRPYQVPLAFDYPYRRGDGELLERKVVLIGTSTTKQDNVLVHTSLLDYRSDVTTYRLDSMRNCRDGESGAPIPDLLQHAEVALRAVATNYFGPRILVGLARLRTARMSAAQKQTVIAYLVAKHAGLDESAAANFLRKLDTPSLEIMNIMIDQAPLVDPMDMRAIAAAAQTILKQDSSANDRQHALAGRLSKSQRDVASTADPD